MEQESNMIKRFIVSLVVVAVAHAFGDDNRDVDIARGDGVRPQQSNDPMRRLFGSYNHLVAPSYPIIVNYTASFTCSYFLPNSRVLRSVIHERYNWNDKRLSWIKVNNDPTHNTLKIPASRLWRPDLKLVNGVQLSERDDDERATIYDNGDVLWHPIVNHFTFCDEYSTTHNCTLMVTSWVYKDEELKVTKWGGKYFSLDSYDYINCAKVIDFRAEPEYLNLTSGSYMNLYYRFAIEKKVLDVPKAAPLVGELPEPMALIMSDDDASYYETGSALKLFSCFYLNAILVVLPAIFLQLF